MRVAATIIASFAICGVAHAEQRTAFDLICGLPGQGSTTFRFDLAQKRWCFAECRRVVPVASVAPERINVLMQGSGGVRDLWHLTFDRYTGAISGVHEGHGFDPQFTGQCEAQPFSGFPQPMF